MACKVALQVSRISPNEEWLMSSVRLFRGQCNGVQGGALLLHRVLPPHPSVCSCSGSLPTWFAAAGRHCHNLRAPCLLLSRDTCVSLPACFVVAAAGRGCRHVRAQCCRTAFPGLAHLSAPVPILLRFQPVVQRLDEIATTYEFSVEQHESLVKTCMTTLSSKM